MNWENFNTSNLKGVLNCVIAVAALFASGALGFPPGTPEATQHAFLAWDAWGLTAVAALNGVLHFMPDFKAPAPPTATGKVASLLLFALLAIGLLGLTSPSTARAAGRDAPAPLSASAKSASSSAALTLPISNPFATLFGGVKTFTVADLQAALADAQAQTPPDTRHAACWSALIPVAEATLVNPLPSGLGAAQAIQKVFDDQELFGSQPWKDAVATACALTVLDLGTDLNSLLAKVGAAAVVIPKL